MARVSLALEMPDEELEPFLQAVRGWERARPEISMAIAIDAPGMTQERLLAIYRSLKPPLPYEYVIPL